MVRPGVSRQTFQAVAAAGVALLALADPAPASFKYLKPGMEAADFTLRTLDDQEITLESLKKTTASLLVFWATWSPNAAPALREAQALEAKHAGAGLRVVAVNLDRPEIGPPEREVIEKSVRDLGLTVVVASDPGFAASAGMGVVAIPSFALLDARGVLFWDGAGWSRTQQLALGERVAQLLGLRAGTAAPAAASGHQPAHKALLNFNLGRSFLRQGNPARAEGLFASAAEIDPGWAAPRTLLGHLLLEQRGGRDVAQAEALFRAAAAIDPADVSALTGLGEALLRENRVNEAATVLEKARQLDPAFTPAVAGRARALARQGRAAEALALYAEALELNPRDAAVFVGRAECRVTEGNLAEGAADYRRAVELLLQTR